MATKTNKEYTVILGEIEFLDKIKEIYGRDCAESIFQIIGDIISKEFKKYNKETVKLFNRIGKNDFIVVFNNINEKEIEEKLEEIEELLEEIYKNYKNRKIKDTILSYGYHYIDIDLLMNNNMHEIKEEKSNNSYTRIRTIDK